MSEETWKELQQGVDKIQSLQHCIKDNISPEWDLRIAVGKGNTFYQMLSALRFLRGKGDKGSYILQVYMDFLDLSEALSPEIYFSRVYYFAIYVDGHSIKKVAQGRKIVNTLCTQMAQLGFSIETQELKTTPIWQGTRENVVGERVDAAIIHGSSEEGIETRHALEFVEFLWKYLIAVDHPWL